MNPKRVDAAASVILGSMQQGKTLPSSFAYDLEAAQMLQSQESADELVRLTARVAELETSARGCDGEGCVLPHSSWCIRAREFAAQHSGCTCGEPWKDTPQPHAGHCWLLSPPCDELEWHRKRVAELLARVSELEAAAFGDAPVRSWDAVDQIGHLRDCLAAQKHRADTLNWISQEQRKRADTAEARVAELEAEVLAVDDLRVRAIDKGDSLRRELDRTSGAAGIAVHRISANGWQCEADATTAIGIRNEVEAIRRAAPADAPHEGPEHHAYRLGRDLPEVPRG
ncbi:hypothetical protein [Streptomyces sp. NPDC058674]|uniref:hypothetical protein n=1 Tax=Streptomyces sp. NPDC058674 TaxID=3346592 RepID=UPI0036506839